MSRYLGFLLVFAWFASGPTVAQPNLVGAPAGPLELKANAPGGSRPEAPSATDATDRIRTIKGNDRVIGAAPALSPLSGNSSGFKFEEAPIAEVITIMLRDVAQVDYVVHPPVAGNVTLSTRGDVSADQAMFLLESALYANGLLMVRDARGTYHVGRAEALRGIVPALRQVGGSPLPPGSGAIVIPLQFIGAAEMASILRPMLPPEAIIRIDTVRNLLVLSGSRAQAEGWLGVVSTFDIDLLKGMSVGVFPLKHANVREVDAALKMLTPGMPGLPTSASGTAAAPAASTPEGYSLFGAVKILPIERLNSVLVVAPRAALIDQAREWIERLDRPGDGAAGAQLFVYPVQNGSAKHLASVLNGLFGNESRATPTSGTGVAPTLPSTSLATAGVSAASASTTAGTSKASLPGAGAPSGAITMTLGSGVRVMADEINNAVLIYGPRAEYDRIESTLKRLDVPPTQVLIEASIIEVSLTDDLQYGLQWLFTDPRGSGNVGTGVLSSVAGGALGGALAGFSYTLRNSLGNVRAVLNALADKSLIKVISSPSIMVLDNHTAAIVVGNQQPIKTGEITTNSGSNPSTSTSYQYKDTGVSLSVLPSVNAGNIVSMQISQAVTDVGNVDTATGQRTFLQRQITSKVAVRSGETLVLGGLIRDNSTSGRSGVPVLQDVPIFGSLFGTRSANTERTELLVIITPRVVRSDQEARDVGLELRERMRGFSAFGSTALPLGPGSESPDRTPKAAGPEALKK